MKKNIDQRTEAAQDEYLFLYGAIVSCILAEQMVVLLDMVSKYTKKHVINYWIKLDIHKRHNDIVWENAVVLTCTAEAVLNRLKEFHRLSRIQFYEQQLQQKEFEQNYAELN